MNYSEKVDQALKFAARMHDKQYRLGTPKTPYIIHPVGVMCILSKYTNDENTLAAALLHDILEDVKLPYQEKINSIKNKFGEQVYEIVRFVSEEKDPMIDSNQKDTWLERKTKYLERIKTAPEAALLVCAADKIHNLRSLIAAHKLEGKKIWTKFHKTPEQGLWFFEQVNNILRERLGNQGIVRDLESEIKKLSELD